MKKSRTFQAYYDPGHGWVKVELSLLKKLGISEKITSYSYVRGDFAYLEEDCDAYTLIKALKDIGVESKFKCHYADRVSKIRGYENYNLTNH